MALRNDSPLSLRRAWVCRPLRAVHYDSRRRPQPRWSGGFQDMPFVTVCCARMITNLRLHLQHWAPIDRHVYSCARYLHRAERVYARTALNSAGVAEVSILLR